MIEQQQQIEDNQTDVRTSSQKKKRQSSEKQKQGGSSFAHVEDQNRYIDNKQIQKSLSDKEQDDNKQQQQSQRDSEYLESATQDNLISPRNESVTDNKKSEDVDQIQDDDDLKMPEIINSQLNESSLSSKASKRSFTNTNTNINTANQVQKSPKGNLFVGNGQNFFSTQKKNSVEIQVEQDNRQQVQNQTNRELFKQPEQRVQEGSKTDLNPIELNVAMTSSQSKALKQQNSSEKDLQSKNISTKGSEYSQLDQSPSQQVPHLHHSISQPQPTNQRRGSRVIDTTTKMSNFINMKIRNFKGNRNQDEAINFDTPEQRLEYFNQAYETAEKDFKAARYYQVITQIAKASEFIHPDFFRRDIKIFQQCLTHLIKGFIMLAQAHFEIKDYESCLLFADIVLQDVESYHAIKLKYKSLIKLNRTVEAQSTLKQLIQTYGKNEICDLEFKEMYIEQQRQKQFPDSDHEDELKPVRILPILKFFSRQLETSKTQIFITSFSSFLLTLLIRQLLNATLKKSKHNNKISVTLGVLICFLLFWTSKKLSHKAQNKPTKNI